MTYDCLILGAGPAGLSAALQCRYRGLSALVIGNPQAQNPLVKAERVDNYLGLPSLTGVQLLGAFHRHLEQCQDVSIITGRVLSAMSYGNSFAISVGSEVYEGKTVIIATGVARGPVYPGEERLLGLGVSYCATCDGMLYRGRDVAVVGLTRDAPEEAAMLAKIGCRVTFVSPRRPETLDGAIPYIKATKLEILGEDKVSGLLADGVELPCEGVFLLRDTIAPTALFPGLAQEGGYIQVDRAMSTNLPGVFACGDCTGLPLQIAKAVGEGQTAAYSAGKWLEQQAESDFE